MGEFRERARALLDGLEEAVGPYPDLAERLREAQSELEAEVGATTDAGSPS